MNAPDNSEQTTIEKSWDIGNILISLSTEINWGIDKSFFTRINELLNQNNQPVDNEYRNDKISYKIFLNLIKALRVKNYDLTNINTAVEKWLRDENYITSPNEISLGEVLNISFDKSVTDVTRNYFKTALDTDKSSFISFSQDDNNLYKLIADNSNNIYLSVPGRLLPAFDANTINSEIDASYFINQLELVSKWINVLNFENNSFENIDELFALKLLVSTIAGNYERSTFEEVALTKNVNDLFYRKIDDKLFQPAFRLLIRNNSDRVIWLTYSFLAFDYSIDSNLFTEIAVNPKQEIWLTEQQNSLSGDMIKMKIDEKYQEEGITKILEFLKIFIGPERIDVSSLDQNAFGEKRNTSRSIGSDFRIKGIGGDRSYDQRLQESFWAIKTLSFQIINNTSENKIEPFNNKWVLISGTGNSKFSNQEKLMSEAIGRLCAQKGYGVICGGWPGVDESVSSSFTAYLSANNISEKDRLVQLLDKKQKSEYEYGKIEKIDLASDWYTEALSRVFVLIMIGGKGGTYKAYEAAAIKNIPVIPIAGADGDAQLVYDLIGKEPEKLLFSREIFEELDQEITPANIENIAATVIAALSELQENLPIPDDETFKQIVEKLYKEKLVTVSDDLQKNRWGSKVASQNKILEAGVVKAKVPGIFDIVHNIKSTAAKQLTGPVAFFLHNSFSREIEYEHAVKGIAQISCTAYEAFTVGAYTADGTMLELDLNEVPGFPQGFYYKDIAETFEKTVEKLYKETLVTVKDDLQKNRWGGKSINGGKQVKATVTKALIPRYFKITVEVSSETQKLLVGDVAFFLHDTFNNEIKYRKAFDGIAKLSLSAFEAFTVGIYCQDGTMLELDLQQQTGYPAEFYYPEEEITAPPRRK